MPLNNQGPQPQSNGQLLAASAGGAIHSCALFLKFYYTVVAISICKNERLYKSTQHILCLRCRSSTEPATIFAGTPSRSCAGYTFSVRQATS